MVLVIGLVLAVMLSLGCTKLIKKYQYIFYIISAVITAVAVIINTVISTRDMPQFMGTYIMPLFTKSIFATSIWIIVMWTGALKNGSSLIKKLMPIRGELSIIATILTLSHVIIYGQIYMVRLFTNSLNPVYMVMTILSAIMVLIMIPLTIISFKKIRKKMNGKLWKKIQKFAYLFYTLIYVHIMILDIPKAQRGDMNYVLNVILYSIIFIGYAVCRIRKWVILRKKPENKAILNTISAIATVVIVLVVSIFAYPFNKNQEIVQVRTGNTKVNAENSTENSANKAVSKTAVTETSTQSGTEISIELSSEKMTETSTEDKKETSTQKTTEKSTEKVTQKTTTNTNNNNNQNNNTVVIEQNNTNETIQQNDNQQIQQNTQQNEVQQDNTIENNNQQIQQNTQQENQQIQQVVTEPPQINYIYNNGTYTATAFGYDGDVEVTITIENDVITNITGQTFESDDYYFSSAKNDVFQQIISKQQSNVDAHAGATYSSTAIMQAVQKALDSARK